MSSDALELLQLEIQEHMDTLAPQLDGFEDISDHRDLLPTTRAQEEKDIADAKRRESLSANALGALQALSDDGYPDLPIIKVHADVYRDLAEQKRTIDAALARYEPLPPEAVGGMVGFVDEAQGPVTIESLEPMSEHVSG